MNQTLTSKIALKPYDIYLAFWIKTLEPIAGDYKIYEKLISENSRFLSQYFENPITVKRSFRKKEHYSKLHEENTRKIVLSRIHKLKMQRNSVKSCEK